MNTSIAVRVDASSEMGIGHAMRCLTLADALRQRGGSVLFVSRFLPESLRETVEQHSHACVVLERESRLVTGKLSHAHWLGTDQLSDAKETMQALVGRTWDWIVVDHYALDARWERVLRNIARRVFVIDDLADRPHDCDVLLDQNYLADGEHRYFGKVPVECRLLVGPRYALMRPEYRQYREVLGARNGTIHRLLVFFGGTDPQNMTQLALDALLDPRLRHLVVDVVCGSDPRRRLEIEEQAAHRPGTFVHGPRPHLADLMAQADLSLGAGGSTTWERLCLGLHTLVITLAENQVQVAQCLASEGLIRLVGRAGDVTVTQLRHVLLDEITRERPTESVAAGMRLSDGLGVARVADIIERHDDVDTRQ